MSITRHPVFTIGHSTHTLDKFIDLLRSHGIAAVADVRSIPYSRIAPQFNQGPLEQALRRHGIRYVFLGQELGGRPDDPSCYDNGQVQFDRVARTDLFTRGIERVLRDANDYHVVLMCTEKEPLNCHRTLLVARALHERGVEVRHILDDGRLEAHEDTMERLRQSLGLPPVDLFHSHEEIIAEAVARQARKVAWAREKWAEEHR